MYVANFRLKEESQTEIHFPTLDDLDEIIEGDQVLRMEGKLFCMSIIFKLYADI